MHGRRAVRIAGQRSGAARRECSRGRARVRGVRDRGGIARGCRGSGASTGVVPSTTPHAPPRVALIAGDAQRARAGHGSLTWASRHSAGSAASQPRRGSHTDGVAPAHRRGGGVFDQRRMHHRRAVAIAGGRPEMKIRRSQRCARSAGSRRPRRRRDHTRMPWLRRIEGAVVSSTTPHAQPPCRCDRRRTPRDEDSKIPEVARAGHGSLTFATNRLFARASTAHPTSWPKNDVDRRFCIDMLDWPSDSDDAYRHWIARVVRRFALYAAFSPEEALARHEG